MPLPLERIDMEAVRSRFDAFWKREVPGRPLVAITCPAGDPTPRDFPVPDTLEDRWTDVEYQCDVACHRAENTVFLGEAFPMFLPNIGPDSFTAYLGGDLRFLDDATSWVEPFVEDLAEFTPCFDPTNGWWRYMCGLVDALCERAPGRFLVGVPDLHGGGDALAAMRHPDRLALDLFDKPDEIKRVMPLLTDIYRQVFDDYSTRIGRVQSGSTTWLPALSRGRYTALQNDFSGLISPAMFDEFFLDEVRQLALHMDNSLYHLDGPSALGNLPLLLGIDELDGIQWVPGAGARPMSEWTDVCRTVLTAGKCLNIQAPAPEVPFLLANLPHEGLFICTWCGSESEGRRLLALVEDDFGR
jgi:5-methyltetrahydrofolate--homocysteine methyltransferase